MVESKSAAFAFVATRIHPLEHRGGGSSSRRDVPLSRSEVLCVRGGAMAAAAAAAAAGGGSHLVGFVGDFATAAITGGIGDCIAQALETPSRNNETDGVSAVVGQETPSSYHRNTNHNHQLEPQVQPRKTSSPSSRFVFLPSNFDSRRTTAYAAFAGIYGGAFQHLWFSGLRRAFPDPNTQLAINQGSIVPLLYYPVLLWMVPKIRARSIEEKQTLRKSIDIKKMVPRNWAFWIPLQSIQFRLVPNKFQVAYCSFCGFLWRIILSWLTAGSRTNNEAKQPKTPEAIGIPTGHESVR